MIKKNLGGRPRIISKNQEWKIVSLNLTKKECKEFDKLRGKSSRAEFVLMLMDEWKLLAS